MVRKKITNLAKKFIPVFLQDVMEKNPNKLFGQPNRMGLVKGWARGWEEIEFNGHRGSVWGYGEVLEKAVVTVA